MKHANESLAEKRQRLLLRELEVVQAAIERAASAPDGASGVPSDWSAKLYKWREDIRNSLRPLVDRAA
ncbi:hypothetical protein MCBRY_003052 [Methylocystis bryophila]|uniref:Uncharacterized protein n=1 Tax=Methylocystis bryophila TaxID=655015 RepID=A0A1W6MWY0_9HYPH|nr:hypothetical protein B1812_14195 [Methylocystis bryophila]